MLKTNAFLGTCFLLSAFAQPLVQSSRENRPAVDAPSAEAALTSCEQRFAKLIRPSDELHDYFRLGLTILHRASKALHSPEATPNDVLYHTILRHEIDQLAQFCDEELTIAAARSRRRPVFLDVTKFGLARDSRTDNRPALEKLLDQVRGRKPGVVLRFPSGKYRFSAAPIPGSERRRAAVCLRNLNGLTLEGRGETTFVVDGATGPGSLYIENCRDVQIRNLVLDMDPLPFTTGAVVAVDPEQSSFEMRIGPDERPADDPFFLQSNILRGKLHEPETGRLYRKEGDLRVISVESKGDRRYRLRVARNDLSSPPGLTAAFRNGLPFVLHGRSDAGRGNGIEIRQGRHVLLRNVTIRGAGLHAVLVEGSAGVQFLDCVLEPAAGRLALNTADGFHVPGNRKGPYLERCTVDRTNDDCANFNSKAESVLRVAGPRQLSIPLSRAASFRHGDLIALVDSNTGQVEAVRELEGIQSGQWQGLPCSELVFSEPLPGEIHSRDSTGRGMIMGREYVLSGGQAYRKAMSITAPFEHLIVNLSVKNDGFIIRNSRMGHNRASGFKCKASNGIVENWTLAGPMDSGILMQIELDWKEAFYPHNVLLDNCRIGTRRPIIVRGGLPGGKTLPWEALPWIRDIEARNCRDEYGKAPLQLPPPFHEIP